MTNLVALLLSVAWWLSSTVSCRLSSEYLINEINMRLPRVRDSLAYSSAAVANDYVVSTAATADRIRHVTSMAYHRGFVYVAAENWLLKVNENTLEIEQSVRYGPVYDSPWCRYFPVEECIGHNDKQLTNNYNKLLLIYEKRGAVLTCWSARQGVCDLRDVANLSNLIEDSSIPVVANDPVNSTVGFIASAANKQDLLYVAATYTNQGPYRGDVPALAGRSLSPSSSSSSSSSNQSPRGFSRFVSGGRRFMDVLSSSQGLKSSKASIEFISRFQKNFIVKYVEAFNLGIYNYFLTVQRMDTFKSHGSQLLTTKLARLCLNDLSFTKSYTEMPLKCTGRGIETRPDSSYGFIDYNELLNAKLIRVRSWQASSYDSNDYYLIGLFQETKRTTFNSSMSSQASKQAVCMFSMRQISEKIRENLNKCYNNVYDTTPIMRGLSFIKPDQHCSSKRQRSFHTAASFADIGDDFCSTADNGIYPIGGKLPAISSASLEFNTDVSPDQFDSLQVWSDRTAASLVLMSSSLRKLSFFHMKSITEFSHYRSVQLSTDAARGTYQQAVSQSLQFQMNGQQHQQQQQQQQQSPPNLFSTVNDVIYKVKMTNCQALTTCNECLMGSDPFCGWCTVTNKCTTNAQCSAATQQHRQQQNSTAWLNGQALTSGGEHRADLFKSMCIDVQSIDPSVVTLSRHEMSWIQVNFRKSLPAGHVNQNSSDYECVFIADGGEMATRAIRIAAAKLKCSVPHVTKLTRLLESRGQFRDQNLTIGSDGIFQVADQYYYEQHIDRLVLPMYVRSVANGNVRYGMVAMATQANHTTTTMFNLTVINCGVHRSCVSCVAAADGHCGWCGNQCRNVNEQGKNDLIN
jgi:hypothetical protein